MKSFGPDSEVARIARIKREGRERFYDDVFKRGKALNELICVLESTSATMSIPGTENTPALSPDRDSKDKYNIFPELMRYVSEITPSNLSEEDRNKFHWNTVLNISRTLKTFREDKLRLIISDYNDKKITFDFLERLRY